MAKKHLKQHCEDLLFTIEKKLVDLLKQRGDDETIHELRVSLRRITPILDLLIALETEAKDKKQLHQHRRVFRTLFKTLSAPRDFEVQVKLARSLTEQLTTEKPKLTRYIMHLEHEQQRLDAQLIKSVAALFVSESIAYLRHSRHLEGVKKTQLLELLETEDALHRQALQAAIQRLKVEAEHFHPTRIQLKKFRYFLELNAVATQSEDKRLNTLKYIQDHLGDTNDLHIALRLMAEQHVDRALIKQVDVLYQDHLQQSVTAIFENLKPLQLH